MSKRQAGKLLIMILLVSLVILIPARSGDAQSVSSGSSSEPARFPFLFADCGPTYVAPVNPAYEQQVVMLVNEQRTAHGLPPYKRVSALDEAARFHAADMIQDGYFDHDSYNAGGTWVCSWSTRVSNWYTGWSHLAENIAGGYASPEDVMSGWMNSDGHRANILSPSNTEIGVGYYTGGEWGSYWVQDFGARWDSHPLVINAEDPETDACGVDIYLYGDFTEMRLKNDDGSFGAWQPFQNSFTWELTSGNGVHTVTAEMRSGSTTVTSSDTITLNSLQQLGGLPGQVSFLYSTASGSLTPDDVWVFPVDSLSGAPVSWTAVQTQPWLQITPAEGTSPQGFVVTASGAATLSPGVYTDVITVKTEPDDIPGSPAFIPVTLTVVNVPLTFVYLPVAGR